MWVTFVAVRRISHFKLPVVCNIICGVVHFPSCVLQLKFEILNSLLLNKIMAQRRFDETFEVQLGETETEMNLNEVMECCFWFYFKKYNVLVCIQQNQAVFKSLNAVFFFTDTAVSHTDTLLSGSLAMALCCILERISFIHYYLNFKMATVILLFSL